MYQITYIQPTTRILNENKMGEEKQFINTHMNVLYYSDTKPTIIGNAITFTEKETGNDMILSGSFVVAPITPENYKAVVQKLTTT